MKRREKTKTSNCKKNIYFSLIDIDISFIIGIFTNLSTS